MRVEFKKTFDALSEIELLARCIYGEARGEPDAGKLAVAHVVLNRVRANGFYGKSVREVILKPWQFSCFNDKDPNLPKIAAETFSKYPIDICRVIASLAIQSLTVDPTGGATLYHAQSVSPEWKDKVRFLCRIGSHSFYKE